MRQKKTILSLGSRVRVDALSLAERSALKKAEEVGMTDHSAVRVMLQVRDLERGAS